MTTESPFLLYIFLTNIKGDATATQHPHLKLVNFYRRISDTLYIKMNTIQNIQIMIMYLISHTG